MNEPMVPLCILSIRRSQKSGRPYLSGWLGQSRVVGFEGPPDKFGNKTFQIFLQAAEARTERRELATIDGVPA